MAPTPMETEEQRVVDLTKDKTEEEAGEPQEEDQKTQKEAPAPEDDDTQDNE